MNIDDLLRKLRIAKDYTKNENGSYTIELMNSDEFDKFRSRFDKFEEEEFLECDDEASNANSDSPTLQYLNDDFIITLLGDIEGDVYKIIIREIV